MKKKQKKKVTKKKKNLLPFLLYQVRNYPHKLQTRILQKKKKKKKQVQLFWIRPSTSKNSENPRKSSTEFKDPVSERREEL